METGLKRLWLRRKSVGRSRKLNDADTQDAFYTPSDYDRGPRTLPPPFKLPGRTPKASTEQPRKSTSTQKSRNEAYDEARRMSFTENPPSRPKSAAANIVRRPVLVGISRPATAGSLQYAVMQAGDEAVEGQPSQMPTVSRFPSLHTVSTPPLSPLARNPSHPRHVDVLDTTNSRPGTGYNEDVAERNLDMLWLALNGPKYKYVPGTKYQDEVASRNAAPPAYRPSAETSRASLETARSSDAVDGRTVSQKALSAAQFGYTHAPAPEAVVAKARAAQDNATAYHSRQGSGKSWEPTSTLPPIPQEPTVEESEPSPLVTSQPDEKLVEPLHISVQPQDDYIVSPINDVEEKFLARDPYPSDLPELDVSRPDSRTEMAWPPSRPSESVSLRSKTPVMVVPNLLGALPKSLPTEEMLLDIDNSLRALEAAVAARKNMPQGGTRANESRPLASQVNRGAFRPTGKLTRNASLPEYAWSAAEVGHNQSRTAQSLSRKASPDPRHILQPQPVRAMSETLLNASTPDIGPVHPGRATSSMKQAVKSPRRTVMDLTEDDAENLPYRGRPLPQGHDESAYTHSRGTFTPAESSTGYILSHEIDSNTIHEIGDSRVVEPKPNFAFSPVTTLASTTPVSSMARSAHESSWEARTQNDCVVLDAHSAILSSVPMSEEQHTTNGEQQGSSHEPRSEGSESDKRQTSPESAEEPLPSPASEKETEHSSQPPMQTPLIIYTSPESLNSGDFVHPQHAFGIMTRDFAVSPSPRPLPAPRETDRPNGLRRQQSEDAQSSKKVPGAQDERKDVRVRTKETSRASTPHATNHLDSRPADFFDEEEFARKQEAARAALRRLQKSLEEGDSLPTVKMNYLANRHLIAQLASGPPSRSQAAQSHTKNNIVDSTVSTPSGASNDGHSRSASQKAADPQSRRESQAFPFPAHAHAHATASTTTRSPARTQTPLQHTPTSPGSISLSAFPMPQYVPERGRTSRTYSEMDRPRGPRRSSQASQTSTASVFSIPYKMIPDRLSSLKDRNLVDADKFRLPEPEVTLLA